MRTGLLEIDYIDEEQYFLIRKENIDSFRYYKYNNKDKDGKWIKSWGFFFIMKDGTSLPVSKKMFLEEVKENINAVDYEKIVKRINEND